MADSRTRASSWPPGNIGGVVVGLANLALSLTPSLLPRPVVAQGVIAGFAFAFGYGVGALAWNRLTRWLPGIRRTLGRRGGVITAALGAAGLALIAPATVRWQNGVRTTVGMDELGGFHWAAFLIGALASAALGVAAARGLRKLYRRVDSRVARALVRDGARPTRRRRLTTRAATATSFVMVVLLGLGVVVAAMLFAVDRVYADSQVTPAALPPPTSPYRSGGPASEIAWESVGKRGAEFLASGPTAADIERVTGRPALEPIRVFGAIHEVPDNSERAALVVRELEALGAAEREFLLLVAPTGTGWVEAQAVDSFEYLHSGNTAIAVQQYSAVPSWRTRIFDPQVSLESTRVFFDAVHEWWSTLPVDDRPRLIVYGLSLGAYAMQSVFPDVETLRGRVDGALFVGTPTGTALNTQLTSRRDPGSPVVLPILDGGRHVRWFSQPGDFRSMAGPWEEPRVAFLQHGTDPVVWEGGTDVFYRSPQWLQQGERSEQVSDQMRWIPVVTGLQALVDFSLSESVPDEAGHKYGGVMVPAWVAVSGTDLDSAAVDAITRVIREYDSEPPLRY